MTRPSYTLEVWTSDTPRAWTRPEYDAHVSCSTPHEDGPHATRDAAMRALDALEARPWAVEVMLRQNGEPPRFRDGRPGAAPKYLATFRRNAAGELVNVRNATGGAL